MGFYGKCKICAVYGNSNVHTGSTKKYSCGTTQSVAQYVQCTSCWQYFHTDGQTAHSCIVNIYGKTTDTIESATIIYN